MALLQRFRAYVEQPVSGASLAVFRVCFALSAVALVIEYYHGHWIDTLQAPFHFPFLHGFAPLSGGSLHIHLALTAFFAVCLGLGIWYRASAILFFMSYSFLFLSEKALYQNHMYLVCLLAFLFSLVSGNSNYSLDNRNNKISRTIPKWNVLIFRFQLVIVYLFSGLAKLNYDWLHGHPQTEWLLKRSQDPFWGHYIGGLLQDHLFVMLITYGGILIDFSVPLLLCFRPTFLIGALLSVLFHLMNVAMFDIDIFPWLMIASIGLFAKEDWPLKIQKRFRQETDTSGARATQNSEIVESPATRHLSRMMTVTLMFYVIFQVLFPLRRFLYSGDTSWTEEGQKFAWRMMLRDKQSTEFKMFFVDPLRNLQGELHPFEVMDQRQIDDLRVIPDMMLQYAQSEAASMSPQFGTRLEIHAVAKASLNGHPAQDLVDSKADLAAVRQGWSHADWIVPLKVHPQN